LNDNVIYFSMELELDRKEIDHLRITI